METENREAKEEYFAEHKQETLPKAQWAQGLSALTKVTSFYPIGCRGWGQKAKIYDTGCKFQMISWT